MTPFLWILLGVVVILGGWLIAVFNGLITLKNKVDEAWSDIDVQTKRRYDLIPNIVETVKGYARHEAATLEKVTAARTAAMGAKDAHAKAAAENMLTETLKSLFAVAEQYPDLKANTNFLDLQKTLTDIEEKIQAARRFYNGNVRDFNTQIQVFPTNMVAGALGFAKREFFEAEAEAKENIQVKF
jgi:LemA protein